MSESNVAEILRILRDRGVRVWSENGELRYAAPKGVMTTDDLASLRANKQEIALYIEHVSFPESGEPQVGVRPRRDRAPPSFSQIAYWNEQKLEGRRVVRGVDSILELKGRLHVEILQECISLVVRRHEGLRTRVVRCHDVLVQEIDECGNDELFVYDLRQLDPEVREIELRRLIDGQVRETVEVSRGPVFSSCLMRLSESENVLIVAMEHIVSDGTSRNILISDIFSAYAQLLRGKPVSLPELPLQFADFSAWQRQTEKGWVDRHAPYWTRHLGGCARLRFPRDKEERGRHVVPGYGTVRLSVHGSLLKALRQWCRTQHTTLTMGLLSAYASFVLRWCGTNEGVFLYQTDGRLSDSIQHAIGYFAFPLYLRIELRESDTLGGLMKRITEEYCNALEHADHAYLKARTPEAPFLRSVGFNWGIQGPSTSSFGIAQGEGEIEASTVFYDRGVVEDFEMDEEPSIALLERTEDIWGEVAFPRDGISFDVMQRFCQEFLLFTERLLQAPDDRISSIPAPASEL